MDWSSFFRLPWGVPFKFPASDVNVGVTDVEPEGDKSAPLGSLALRSDAKPAGYLKCSSLVQKVGWRPIQTCIPIVVTASLDFASTLTGRITESAGQTVTGAVIGDAVLVTPPVANAAGTFWMGYVSDVDTVIIQFANLSGGSVDPAAGLFTIKVIPKL